jgi:hypothetical protein
VQWATSSRFEKTDCSSGGRCVIDSTSTSTGVSLLRWLVSLAANKHTFFSICDSSFNLKAAHHHQQTWTKPDWDGEQ